MGSEATTSAMPWMKRAVTPAGESRHVIRIEMAVAKVLRMLSAYCARRAQKGADGAESGTVERSKGSSKGREWTSASREWCLGRYGE